VFDPRRRPSRHYAGMIKMMKTKMEREDDDDGSHWSSIRHSRFYHLPVCGSGWDPFAIGMSGRTRGSDSGC
jgi:hypothetical protein